MFFLFILIIILILIIITYTSKICIEIENLNIDTEAQEKINKDSKVYVYLLILGKIKLLKHDVKNLKIKNKRIDMQFLKQRNLKIDYKDLFRNIRIQFRKIDLYAQIGTEDAALTAILVGTLSSILGVILRKPKYQIVPIYVNKNLLKIKLNGIFTINLMQYIYKLITNRKKKDKSIFQNKKMEVNYE